MLWIVNCELASFFVQCIRNPESFCLKGSKLFCLPPFPITHELMKKTSCSFLEQHILFKNWITAVGAQSYVNLQVHCWVRSNSSYCQILNTNNETFTLSSSTSFNFLHFVSWRQSDKGKVFPERRGEWTVCTFGTL